MTVVLVESGSESAALGVDGILEAMRRRFRGLVRTRRPYRVVLGYDRTLGRICFRRFVDRANGCVVRLDVGPLSDAYRVEIGTDAGTIRVVATREPWWPWAFVVCAFVLVHPLILGSTRWSLALPAIVLVLVSTALREHCARVADEATLVAAMLRFVPGLEAVTVRRDEELGPAIVAGNRTEGR